MSSPLTSVTFDQIWHHLYSSTGGKDLSNHQIRMICLVANFSLSQVRKISNNDDDDLTITLIGYRARISQNAYLPDGCPVFKDVHFSQHIYNIWTWIQSKKITTQKHMSQQLKNLSIAIQFTKGQIEFAAFSFKTQQKQR